MKGSIFMSVIVEVAFLGGIYPDDISKIQQNSKAPLDYAADAYQKKYLSYLQKMFAKEISIFSRLVVGSWPINYRLPFVFEKGKSRFGIIDYINYCNVIGIRSISQRRATEKKIVKWYKEKVKEADSILFVYSAVFAKEIIHIKKRCPNLKICYIIPDMPKYTYLSSNSILRKLVLWYRQKNFEEACRHVDFCISITEAMEQYIKNISTSPCKTIEAIADEQRCLENLRRLEQLEMQLKYKTNDMDENKKIIILYSGTLAKIYGILDLLSAFQKIQNNNCVLYICGGGDAEPEVQEATRRDDRIVYLGMLPNEQVKKLQNEADILVNPRKPEGEYTIYSFPSKTMEYLETGNLVISYMLAGIPDEYRKMLLCPDDSGLFMTLQYAINMQIQEKIDKGKRNLHYLLENKCGKALESIVNDLLSSKAGNI